MRAVVEVVHSDPDGLLAGLLAGVGTGVEHLGGQQPVVPLDLALVARRVCADPMVPAGQGLHCAGNVLGPVVGAVLGDDPADPLDPVGGEEHPRPA